MINDILREIIAHKNEHINAFTIYWEEVEKTFSEFLEKNNIRYSFRYHEYKFENGTRLHVNTYYKVYITINNKVHVVSVGTFLHYLNPWWWEK